MPDFQPGTIVDGKFEIIRSVGEGGMGQVYRARQLDLSRDVALKVLHAGLAVDPEAAQRFQREGKVLSELQHPNIPQFYHFGIWAETHPYIAMEFLDGIDLRELMDCKTRNWPEILKVLIEACDALDCVHQCGFSHRDLKPNNIMLVNRNQANSTTKIVDFGLAGLIGPNNFDTLTKSGALVGSIFYMSPEQCTGKKCDAKSDVYSMGCIIYECLAGAPPFVSDNPVLLLQKHVRDTPKSVCKSLRYPAELEHLVTACLSKSPEDRPTIGSIRATLTRTLQEFSDTKQFAVPVNAVEGKISTTLLVFGVLAALLFLVVQVQSRVSPWRSSVDKTGDTATINESNRVSLQSMLDDAAKKILDGRSSDAATLLKKIPTQANGRSEQLQDLAKLLRVVAMLQANPAVPQEECMQMLAELHNNSKVPWLKAAAARYLGKIEASYNQSAALSHIVEFKWFCLRHPDGVSKPLSLLLFPESCDEDRLLRPFAIRTNSYNQVVPLWKEWVTKSPGNQEALLGLSHFYRLQKNFSEASSIVLKNMHEHPDEPEWQNEFINLLCAQGRERAAIMVANQLEQQLREAAIRLKAQKHGETEALRNEKLANTCRILAGGECGRQHYYSALRLAKLSLSFCGADVEASNNLLKSIAANASMYPDIQEACAREEVPARR